MKTNNIILVTSIIINIVLYTVYMLQPVPKTIIKEVVKEVPVEKIVIKEVVKEVPVEKIIYKETPKAVNMTVEPRSYTHSARVGSVGAARTRRRTRRRRFSAKR